MACCGTIPASYGVPAPAPQTPTMMISSSSDENCSPNARAAAPVPPVCTPATKSRVRARAPPHTPGENQPPKLARIRGGIASPLAFENASASSSESMIGGIGKGTAQVQGRELRSLQLILKAGIEKKGMTGQQFVPSAAMPEFPPKSVLDNMKDRMNQNRRRKYRYDQRCIAWYKNEIALL